MATFYSNSSLYYQLKLDVTPRSQDVANNTSTLDWVLTLNMSHGYYFYSHECGTTVKIGGKTVHSSNKTRSFSSATPTVLERGTVTVTHNSDGSLNAGIYAYFDVAKSDYTPQVPLTINTSMRLSTIPRASTPTLSNSSIYYGQSVRIYTNRKSTSFTHTIRATWNGKSETIKSGVTDYYDWTVPDKYMDRIPNNTSTQGTIYLDTYNGSTKIGTKSINLTTNVPSHVNPYVKRAAIGIPNSFIEIDKKFGAYIQNKSKAYFIIESEGKYSSTIKTNQIVSNGRTLSSSRNPYEATTDYLRNSGTNTVIYKTIDSRGRTGSISKTYNVLAYESPKILSFNVQRSNADGTPAPNGEYARIEYKLNVTPLNDKNDKTYTLKYKRKDTNDAWTSVSLDNSSYSPNTYRTVSRVNIDSSYVFRLEVTDYFESAATEATIGTASTFMEWRDGGKGLSLGKFSEKDGLEVDWPSYFYQSMYGPHDKQIVNSKGDFAVQDNRTEDGSTDFGDKGVRFNFRRNDADGLNDSGSFHGVMSFQPWTDKSGGKTHELAFTDGDNLYARHADIGGQWGTWNLIPRGIQTVLKVSFRDDSTTNWKEVLESGYPKLNNGQAYFLQLLPKDAQVWAIGFKAAVDYGSFLITGYTNFITHAQLRGGVWDYYNIR